MVIDLRHLLIVGKSFGIWGSTLGNTNEVKQFAVENYWRPIAHILFSSSGDGDPNSGGNAQDYYSNELGYSFFYHYGNMIKTKS